MARLSHGIPAVPQADLTVVAIANLGSIDPWRQSRAIATLALEGDKRLKPAVPALSEAEIKPLSRHLVQRRRAVAVRTGMAQRRGDGDAERDALRAGTARRRLAGGRTRFVRIRLKPGRTGTARVDLGAGRVLTFKKLGRRKSVPAAIAGRYVSADTGASWEIKRSGEDWAAAVGGPLIAAARPGRCAASTPTPSRSRSPGSWLQVTQLAHLGARPRRPRGGAGSIDRPHQEDAVRGGLSSRAKRGIFSRHRERSLASLGMMGWTAPPGIGVPHWFWANSNQ